MREKLDFPVLLIDGDCSLCNTSVKLILKLEGRPVLRFAAINSNVGRALISKYDHDEALPDSVLLIDQSGLHLKSMALVRIGKHAGGWLTILRLAGSLPRSWADGLYDFVARNRKRWFGTAKYCAGVGATDRQRFLDL